MPEYPPVISGQGRLFDEEQFVQSSATSFLKTSWASTLVNTEKSLLKQRPREEKGPTLCEAITTCVFSIGGGGTKSNRPVTIRESRVDVTQLDMSSCDQTSRAARALGIEL